MKLTKLTSTIGAFALGLCLQPSTGWSTRAYAPPITGTVTAQPTSGAIEIDHRSYPIKVGSDAAKVLASLYVGETVDIVVDGPPGSTAEVIRITQHQE